MKKINTLKLFEDLLDAGIPIDGVASTDPVQIDFKPEATAAQRAQAEQIVANHNPASKSKQQNSLEQAKGSVQPLVGKDIRKLNLDELVLLVGLLLADKGWLDANGSVTLPQ